MLTDYFCWYKLDNKSTPFQEEKNSSKFKDCQVFSVIKVLGYSNIGVHLLQKEKNIFFQFFTHAFQKKLALIILVHRLHSIITYVVCCSRRMHCRVYKFDVHACHSDQRYFVNWWISVRITIIKSTFCD